MQNTENIIGAWNTERHIVHYLLLEQFYLFFILIFLLLFDDLTTLNYYSY